MRSSKGFSLSTSLLRVSSLSWTSVGALSPLGCGEDELASIRVPLAVAVVLWVGSPVAAVGSLGGTGEVSG